MTRPQPIYRLDDQVFARAGHVLGARCGLRFDASNRELLEEGLLRAAASQGNSAAELVDRLENASTDALLQAVVRQVTIGETYFFRHPEHFDILRDRVLPDLLAARRDIRRLRAWSAGCATGEEAWSLAMALGSGAGPAWDVHVLGTDINKAALEQARRGHYGRWSLRSPMQCMPGHVEHLPDGTVRVSESLRERARFEYLNLRDAIYPSIYHGTQGLDVIFCRNVLAYFLPEVASAVLERFRQCLVEGGWLVVSAFDVSLAPEGFEVLNWGGTAVLRKRSVVKKAEPAIPPSRRTPSAPVTPRTPPASAPATPNARAAELTRSAKNAADAGDLDRAATLARMAVEAARTPEALRLYALVLGERCEHAEKAALLRELLERCPDDVLAHLALGLGESTGEGAPDRARHLRRVIELVRPRRDDEILPGPDPLPVSWVRKMATAALKTVER